MGKQEELKPSAAQASQREEASGQGLLLALNSYFGDSYSATTITDAEGYYRFDGLASGTYTLTLSKSGYIFDPIDVTVSNEPVENITVTPTGRRLYLPVTTR